MRAGEHYVVDRKVCSTKEADMIRRVGEKDRGVAIANPGDHPIFSM